VCRIGVFSLLPVYGGTRFSLFSGGRWFDRRVGRLPLTPPLTVLGVAWFPFLVVTYSLSLPLVFFPLPT